MNFKTLIFEKEHFLNILTKSAVILNSNFLVMKPLIIFFFTITFFLLNCQEKIEQSVNLLSNPGFEEIVDSNPAGWKIKTADQTSIFQSGISKQSHHGEHSMMFGRVWTDAWEMNGFRTENPVFIDPENKYLLTFWYKTENIREYPIPLVVRLNVQRENTKPLRYQKFISTGNEWTQIKWLLDTLPPDEDMESSEKYR